MGRNLILFCLMMGLSQLVNAAENKAAGEEIASTVCAACHGLDGNSTVGMYPKIAGQHKGYLIAAIKEYKKGDGGGRNNPVMYDSVKNLSDQDIFNLAAYFSSQEQTANGAVEDLVPLGRSIYVGGNKKTGLPACLACHGPTGDGNGPARFPKISGQQVDYLISQLKAFRSGDRVDVVGGMMNDVSAKMSDIEIEAVASFAAGLHMTDLNRYQQS